MRSTFGRFGASSSIIFINLSWANVGRDRDR